MGATGANVAADLETRGPGEGGFGELGGWQSAGRLGTIANFLARNASVQNSVPNLGRESDQVTALTVLQYVVAHGNPRVFQLPKETSHPGANRGSSTSASSPSDDADHRTRTSPGLGSEESIGIDDRLLNRLTV